MIVDTLARSYDSHQSIVKDIPGWKGKMKESLSCKDCGFRGKVKKWIVAQVWTREDDEDPGIRGIGVVLHCPSKHYDGCRSVHVFLELDPETWNHEMQPGVDA